MIRASRDHASTMESVFHYYLAIITLATVQRTLLVVVARIFSVLAQYHFVRTVEPVFLMVLTLHHVYAHQHGQALSVLNVSIHVQPQIRA